MPKCGAGRWEFFKDSYGFGAAFPGCTTQYSQQVSGGECMVHDYCQRIRGDAISGNLRMELYRCVGECEAYTPPPDSAPGKWDFRE